MEYIKNKYWNAKETIGLTIIIMFIIGFIQKVITYFTHKFQIYISSHNSTFDALNLDKESLLSNDYDFKLIINIISACTTILILYSLAKVKCNKPLTQYFNLGKQPQFKWLITYLLLFFGYMVLVYLINTFLDLPRDTSFMNNVANMKFILIGLIAVVITIPFMEELLFRGFLFKGFSQSRLGNIGSIFLISFIFASLHIGQYNISSFLIIFLFSLLLGFARYNSHSLWLPIYLHSINNFLALFYIYFNE